MVQEWSVVAAAGDLAGASHQDTNGCYRREIRIRNAVLTKNCVKR